MEGILFRIKRYFDEIQKSLLWVLFADFIIVLFIDIWGRNLCPEKSFIYNFVNFIYTLGLSYFASFIFFYIQSFLKEYNDKRKIMPTIEGLFAKLLTYMNDIVIDAVLKIDPSDMNLQFKDIDEERFVTSISKSRFNDGSSVYQGAIELTWIQYFSIRRQQIEVSRKNILDFARYLDGECLSLLADICEDQFLNVLFPTAEQCLQAGLKIDMPIGEAGEFCKPLYELIVNLNGYYDKILYPYHKNDKKQIKGIHAGSHKQIIL